MTERKTVTNTYKDFDFASFVTNLGPKLNAVLNANCNFDFQDISNTYKNILSEVGIENTNYNNFRKALLHYIKEREASYCTLSYIHNKSSYTPPKPKSILNNYYIPFVFEFGFFPGVGQELIEETQKFLFVTTLAHGCRFIPTNGEVALSLDLKQFEAFTDYEPILASTNYSKIESIVNNKNWYRFLDCKWQFDLVFNKHIHMIAKYVITDPETLNTRKKLIFDVLNQNGKVNVTNSYLESSIASFNYKGISLFELSILQTLAVGCLKYIPHGSELVGDQYIIRQFISMAKKRNPIIAIKKLTELAVVLGYNAVMLEPTELDIQEINDMIVSYTKYFNEVKYNLENFVFLILQVGIDNAKIDIQSPTLAASINPKSLLGI